MADNKTTSGALKCIATWDEKKHIQSGSVSRAQLKQFHQSVLFLFIILSKTVRNEDKAICHSVREREKLLRLLSFDRNDD